MKILIVAAILFFAVEQLNGKEPAHPREWQPKAQSTSTNITQTLEEIRRKHKLPALAAAVVVKGNLVTSGAVGIRKEGATETVTTSDKFHIGSVTKSMTATVAAMLVEQGKLAWTNTIASQFPEILSEIHPGYHNVTLEQLLAHRGGAPGTPPNRLWTKAWEATGTPAEQRLAFAKDILRNSPEWNSETKHIYSNAGYTIAGVMLEKATGKTWEDLMRSMLFEPLKMETAGFGPPASVGAVDHPWGHKAGVLSIIPMAPGPKADNPLAISPAGAVHCSIEDLAKYAAFHLAGDQGEGTLLKPETFKRLHKAIGKDEYALGWVVVKRKWAGGDVLMHNGSNTMFYVVVWIAPKKDFAVVVATNVGIDYGFAGCDDVAWALIEQYVPR